MFNKISFRKIKLVDTIIKKNSNKTQIHWIYFTNENLFLKIKIFKISNLFKKKFKSKLIKMTFVNLKISK